MPRYQLLLLTICLVTISVGCRNYGNNCHGGGAFAGGSATIAPPPTYSLNIPSVAGNQPYYTPGQTAPTNNTLNTNQRAPTPAIRQATQLNQGGWRSADNNLSSNSNVAPLNTSSPNNGRSVLAAPTTFAGTTPNANTGSGTRTASNAALPGSGASFTSSPNYQTTRVDETQDSTRVPLSDATAVRAPARNFPTGTPLTQVQNNGYAGNFQTGVFNPPLQQTYVAQTGAFQQAPAGYSAAPVIIGGQPVPTGYQGQPLIASPIVNQQQYPTYSTPTVLAQSTTTATPGAGGQLGWRDRDLTGSRSNRF